MPQLDGANDRNNPSYNRAVESCSPEPSHPRPPDSTSENAPAVNIPETKDALSRDASARTKESESIGAGDTPESSKLAEPI